MHCTEHRDDSKTHASPRAVAKKADPPTVGSAGVTSPAWHRLATRVDTLAGGVQQASADPVQAKLTVGAPNDQYEQEADRVADQIMRMPARDVRRKPT